MQTEISMCYGYVTPTSCIGVVMLDVKGEDFPTIANEIVETLLSSGQLPWKQRESVLKILLKKHKHSNDITLWDKLKQSAVHPGEWVWQEGGVKPSLQ